MSRFENKTITLPAGVTMSYQTPLLCVKGAKGENTFRIPSGVEVNFTQQAVSYSAADHGNTAKVGLCYRMTQNLITGVAEGFTKHLEIKGVGYRWSINEKTLKMQLGYSNDIFCPIPNAINIEIKGNNLVVAGIDKQAVGAFAAKIRNFRSVEPYKGKGIRYKNEFVIKKVGKAGKTAG